MVRASAEARGDSPRSRFVVGFVLGALTAGVMVLLVGPRCEGPGHAEIRLKSRCEQNLNAIGKSFQTYRAEHDRVPEGFAALLAEGSLDPRSLTCPGSKTEPVGPDGSGDMAAWCDYVFVAGLHDADPGGVVAVFELPANHGQDSASFLTLGGAVVTCNFPGHLPGDFLTELQRVNRLLAARRRSRP